VLRRREVAPLPTGYAKLGSGWFGMRKKDLQSDRKHVVGFCRAVAKSTLFAYTNFDRAVDLHWALYPDSKPRTSRGARSRSSTASAARTGSAARGTPTSAGVPRRSRSGRPSWRSRPRRRTTRSCRSRSAPLSNVYTNELIDEINNFDKAAVVKQAKEFRL
jgi:NitT/TauT family transport system substrate-binding protein